MQQVWITKVGAPEVLQARGAPDPEPKPHQIRIRVKAAGINFADIMARVGLYPDAPALPCVVGYEVAGDIDAVGSQIKNFKEGDKVVALTRFGGYSDCICVADKQVFHIPREFSYAQAAAIPVNYATAYQMMVVMAALKKNERILIHGAAGGVGLATIDIGKIIGAEMLGTASASKHPFIKERGLTYPIDYRNLDFEEEVKRLTGGEGVHVALDPIGGKSWLKSYRCLCPTGRLVMFGFQGAATHKGRSVLGGLKNLASTPWTKFNPLTLMNDNKAVIGVNLGHMWNRPDWVHRWLRQVFDWAEQGLIRPHVDKEFSLTDAAAAHHYIQDRKNIGKVVLVP